MRFKLDFVGCVEITLGEMRGDVTGVKALCAKVGTKEERDFVNAENKS